MGNQSASAPPTRYEFTEEELLGSHPYEEPLYAGGVLCHGGFVDGAYVSPRTAFRRPAIEAWQRRLADEGQLLIRIPEKYVPPQYPSCAQAKYLLENRVVDPITRALTTISIVEGFGARIRDVRVPDLRELIVEDIDGTALAHLDKGLFEAHARDEAGHRKEGGHKQMWEAARDLGLDKPEIPGDVLARMMMGRSGPERKRMFPELSESLEQMITMMSSVLVVEVFAEDVFEWAKELLGDGEVSANPVEAASMVANIQADESPHVDYLRTALSELRARTLRTSDGKGRIAGSEVVDRILEEMLRRNAAQGPKQRRETLHRELKQEVADLPNGSEIWRRFTSLDSGWAFPEPEDQRLDLLVPAA